VIKTLLGHNGALVRGALAFVLGKEEDIEVLAELDRGEQVVPTMLRRRPDVTVIDLDMLGVDSLPVACALNHSLPRCRMLILAERRQSAALSHVIATKAPGVGFLAKDGPPYRLVDAVRRVARGDLVLDPELVVAALHSRSPLTQREVEVLAAAARGRPVKEIAARMCLSQGTVRNHVSRIIAKTGARSRIEAVRIASDAGWI
jgi:two-component system response regulator DesR